MKSVYGIRLCDILKCDDNKAKGEKCFFKYPIHKLREMLNCKDKFHKISQLNQLKEKVIEKAVQEINNNTDLFAKTKCVKTGRKITDIQFEIFYNTMNGYLFPQNQKNDKLFSENKSQTQI